ncbi:MAG: helix-turn-helix transcriptional regulator [Candidatus Paceibacterota bacterium]|jgi:transcriptional regulator with XRE-family HTH domain
MANLERQFLIFLGKKIREKRDKMGVTQEEMGKIMKMHRTYVGMVERGEKNISVQNLKRFSVALKVKMSELIDF